MCCCCAFGAWLLAGGAPASVSECFCESAQRKDGSLSGWMEISSCSDDFGFWLETVLPQRHLFSHCSPLSSPLLLTCFTALSGSSHGPNLVFFTVRAIYSEVKTRISFGFLHKKYNQLTTVRRWEVGATSPRQQIRTNYPLTFPTLRSNTGRNVGMKDSFQRKEEGKK